MIRALEIRRVPQALQFAWTDSTQTEIPLGWLRRNCTCAVCIDRGSDNFPIFSSREQMDAAFTPKELLAIGNYGFEIVWKDNHRSIFAFERVKTSFEAMGLPPHLQSVKNSVEQAV